jgi:hypothetical protein
VIKADPMPRPRAFGLTASRWISRDGSASAFWMAAIHLIEHSVEQMLAQRVYALALGYEDLNDHEQLRHDPLLRRV